MPSEKVRAYIYRILIASGTVAAFYGILSSEEVAVWLGLVAVILNVLPAMNTTTHPEK